MKTLVINTYGGSLALGARAMGAEILGLYEDSGFGSDIQAANFPDIEQVRRIADWPARDLGDTVVIAHPPCSAFSVQNTSPFARGVDSDAFDCTKKVLAYASRNRARAICVESVVGALSGAWDVHQEVADDHGYHLYRVLQNGAMFSAQWRDRFWAIWVRKDAAPERMRLAITPRWQTIGEVIRGYNDGPAFQACDTKLIELKRRFTEEAFCTPEEMTTIFAPHDPPYDGGVSRTLHKLKYPDWDLSQVREQFVTTFATSGMRFISPVGLAPVLLSSSWWYIDGRNLAVDGYKRIMGFPADYIFPDKYYNKMRTFLSKGVVPAVAAWVLRTVQAHLETLPVGGPTGQTYQLSIEPNQIADFRIKRDSWDWRNEKLPELRHHDD